MTVLVVVNTRVVIDWRCRELSLASNWHPNKELARLDTLVQVHSHSPGIHERSGIAAHLPIGVSLGRRRSGIIYNCCPPERSKVGVVSEYNNNNNCNFPKALPCVVYSVSVLDASSFVPRWVCAGSRAASLWTRHLKGGQAEILVRKCINGWTCWCIPWYCWPGHEITWNLAIAYKNTTAAMVLSILRDWPPAIHNSFDRQRTHLDCGDVIEAGPERVKDTKDSFEQFNWVGDACLHEA